MLRSWADRFSSGMSLSLWSVCSKGVCCGGGNSGDRNGGSSCSGVLVPERTGVVVDWEVEDCREESLRGRMWRSREVTL